MEVTGGCPRHDRADKLKMPISNCECYRRMEENRQGAIPKESKAPHRLLYSVLVLQHTFRKRRGWGV